MKFFDAGAQATGVIAFGQEATGFIAVGQMATGVIAIGQLARGVVAIGQCSIGWIGWGQVGCGVFHAVGMVGVGGRGLGLVVRVVPSIGRPRVAPQVMDTATALVGAEGWIAVDLHHDGAHFGFFEAGQRLPIKLDRRLQAGALALLAPWGGTRRVFAYTKRLGTQLVCERIAHEPPRPYEKPGFTALAAAQLVGLLVVALAWWAIVGGELVGKLGDGGLAREAPISSGELAVSRAPSEPSKPSRR